MFIIISKINIILIFTKKKKHHNQMSTKETQITLLQWLQITTTDLYQEIHLCGKKFHYMENK